MIHLQHSAKESKIKTEQITTVRLHACVRSCYSTTHQFSLALDSLSRSQLFHLISFCLHYHKTMKQDAWRKRVVKFIFLFIFCRAFRQFPIKIWQSSSWICIELQISVKKSFFLFIFDSFNNFIYFLDGACNKICCAIHPPCRFECQLFEIRWRAAKCHRKCSASRGTTKCKTSLRFYWFRHRRQYRSVLEKDKWKVPEWRARRVL